MHFLATVLKIDWEKLQYHFVHFWSYSQRFFDRIRHLSRLEQHFKENYGN